MTKENFVIGTTFNGRVALMGISYGATKTGSDMMSFAVRATNGEQIRGVCFDANLVKIFKEQNVTSVIGTARLNVQEYNGKSCVLDSIEVDENASLSEFYDSIDPDRSMKAILKQGKKLMSDEGVALLQHIYDNEPELKTAMAAQISGNHDGVSGGLLNHIRKLFNIAYITMFEYSKVFSKREMDIVFVGLFVHDLGKIYELTDGAYDPYYSRVGHTYWGTVVLAQFKEYILEHFDEDFYVELIAIIQQHHAQWGERPNTLYSYIVHQIDLLDSTMSSLREKIDIPKSPSVLDVSIGVAVRDTTKVRFQRYLDE